MTSDQIHDFVSQAIGEWMKAVTEGNAGKANLNIQTCNLVLLSEIASHLADRNKPQIVSFTWHGDPVLIASSAVTGIRIEREAFTDMNRTEKLPPFAVIYEGGVSYAVDQSIQEVCALLDIPCPKMKEPEPDELVTAAVEGTRPN